MKKHLKKLILGTLSAGLVLSLVPATIFASETTETSEETEELATEETEEPTQSSEETEDTEETSEESTEDTEATEGEEDLTPSADNPYTEAEFTELIKPIEEWDPNLVLERADLEAGYQEVLDTATECSMND